MRMVSFWIKYLWQQIELSLGWRDAEGMEGCCSQGAAITDSGADHYRLQHGSHHMGAPASCMCLGRRLCVDHTAVSLTWELDTIKPGPDDTANQHSTVNTSGAMSSHIKRTQPKAGLQITPKKTHRKTGISKMHIYLPQCYTSSRCQTHSNTKKMLQKLVLVIRGSKN